MIESTLWKHLKPELRRLGKFQKISDRFTPGVPDVLGCSGAGIAMELKEFDGVRVLKVSFRPGQLDWLRDWSKGGGISWIVVSHRQTVYVFRWQTGPELEEGCSPDRVDRIALLKFTKNRGNSWKDFVTQLAALDARIGPGTVDPYPRNDKNPARSRFGTPAGLLKLDFSKA